MAIRGTISGSTSLSQGRGHFEWRRPLAPFGQSWTLGTLGEAHISFVFSKTLLYSMCNSLMISTRSLSFHKIWPGDLSQNLWTANVVPVGLTSVFPSMGETYRLTTFEEILSTSGGSSWRIAGGYLLPLTCRKKVPNPYSRTPTCDCRKKIRSSNRSFTTMASIVFPKDQEVCGYAIGNSSKIKTNIKIKITMQFWVTWIDNLFLQFWNIAYNFLTPGILECIAFTCFEECHRNFVPHSHTAFFNWQIHFFLLLLH